MRTFGDLEARIMHAIWAHDEPLTVHQLVDALTGEKPIAYTTVITVTERLRAKGWLARERVGRAYRYSATLQESEYEAKLMGLILQKSENRSAALLSFAGQLDPEEAVALRKALDDATPEDPER